MKLRKLTIVGPFRGASGYDHHVRAFTRELARQGIDIELIDLHMWSPKTLAPELRDPWFESLSTPVGSNVVLHFATPHLARPFPKRKNANFTMFEADRIPDAWRVAANHHDLVILPTETSRQSWIRSGVDANRIRLCPLGVDPEIFSGKAEPLRLALADGTPVSLFRTRILNVSEFDPRKNLPGLFRAWLQATTPQDDAVLILKVGLSNPGAEDLLNQDIATVERDLGKALDEAAPVCIFPEVLPDSEMPGLYAAATHYISVSFGEGWDLPMMEAASSNLRLIAPAHSAYLTYLDDSIADLIPARETAAVYRGDCATAALFRDSAWWAPDIDAAAQAIRTAIDGRDGNRERPRDRIASRFNWGQSTQQLIALLEELDATPSRRWYWPWSPKSSDSQ